MKRSLIRKIRVEKKNEVVSKFLATFSYSGKLLLNAETGDILGTLKEPFILDSLDSNILYYDNTTKQLVLINDTDK